MVNSVEPVVRNIEGLLAVLNDARKKIDGVRAELNKSYENRRPISDAAYALEAASSNVTKANRYLAAYKAELTGKRIR